jgi:prepilin-type N-terminal cleavage/methylation domain-containing protein
MKNKGFTLIELLIVVGILAVLIGAIAAAVNPPKQFAKANNSRRWADVMNIMNAVSQNIVDGKGVFNASSTNCGGTIPTTSPMYIANAAAPEYATFYDLCGCIVPGYIGSLPVDPLKGSPANGVVSCAGTYHTYYTIQQNATSGRITISAPLSQSEGGTTPVISLTR